MGGCTLVTNFDCVFVFVFFLSFFLSWQVVLAVLVKNFVFELRDGVDSKIEIGRSVFPRPKLAGEVGCQLPLRVRPYVASG